jgi:acetyl-CoA C-acetyltransferase
LDDLAILGVGSTRFGAYGGARTARDLGREAVCDALRDADITPDMIDAAYVGTSVTGLLTGQESMVGQLALEECGLVGLPITRVESACSSGSAAVREASLAIRAGTARAVLVLGVEVMTSASTAEGVSALAGAGDIDYEGALGMTFPGHFAMIAQRHAYEYGTTREQLAAVAVKNHENGARNPKAHFQRQITAEQVLRAAPVADPLGILDCCPLSDGAAALVLARRDDRGPRDVRLRACEMVSGTYADDRPLTEFETTPRAAAAAYEEAGLGPDEIDLWEVHDCFTIAELVHTEDLGLCGKGEGGEYIASGATAAGGEHPVNVSGGLKAKGHPVGATGVGQLVELTTQVRGEAGERQVDGARAGLAHCMGGFLHGDSGSITVSIVSA